ncbi:hypothetical protein J6G99_08410 [bacterium]|nr:hypothetical protein [bacterium]
MTPEENNIQTPEDAIKIAKQSVKRKQKERKLRKQRKKLKRLKAFLRFLLFILIISGAYVFFNLSGWYLPKDTFSKYNPKRIEVLNNNMVPSPIIYKKLSEIKPSSLPIFIMPVGSIKHKLFEIPVFKNIYVRRYGFPARIQIIVRERIPVAVIKTDLKAKPSAFMTADGIMVTDKNYMRIADNDSVLKILASNPKIGTDWTVKKVQHIEKIVKAVEAYSSEKVQYIDMRNPNDVYVRIDTTAIRLGLLDSTVFDRIKRIYTILPQINEVDGQVKYVDLSWDKVNYIKLDQNKKEENE